jgi:hypothetical protein
MAKASKPLHPAVGGEARAVFALQLVPLEARLRRLRKVEAKRQRQFDRVHARAAEASAEMAGLLADLKKSIGEPAGVVTAPASSSGQGLRLGIRRLVGA